ncbi:hypothetical protein WJX72_006843 [[Myrmecia] bisecta]|uniref:Uncharacterized protein n=1 Tax=[Myrmecia] bisecta TaxID=41462 RepID=A0AAW1QBL6_9CHLO
MRAALLPSKATGSAVSNLPLSLHHATLMYLEVERYSVEDIQARCQNVLAYIRALPGRSDKQKIKLLREGTQMADPALAAMQRMLHAVVDVSSKSAATSVWEDYTANRPVPLRDGVREILSTPHDLFLGTGESLAHDQCFVRDLLEVINGSPSAELIAQLNAAQLFSTAGPDGQQRPQHRTAAHWSMEAVVIKGVQVGLPCSLLEPYIVLDSPGIDDGNPIRAQIAATNVERADVVIAVVTSTLATEQKQQQQEEQQARSSSTGDLMQEIFGSDYEDSDGDSEVPGRRGPSQLASGSRKRKHSPVRASHHHQLDKVLYQFTVEPNETQRAQLVRGTSGPIILRCYLGFMREVARGRNDEGRELDLLVDGMKALRSRIQKLRQVLPPLNPAGNPEGKDITMDQLQRSLEIARQV